MNTFEHRIFLKGIPYSIFVDSSKGDEKRVIINNREIVKENCSITSFSRRHIIYYPIDINGAKIVIEINDVPLEHEYNLYVDDVSVINGNILSSEYNDALKKSNEGFKAFCKNNWRSTAKDNLFSLLISFVVMFFFAYFNFDGLIVRTILTIVFLPLYLPIFLVAEWVHIKNLLKNYKNCFREEKFY